MSRPHNQPSATDKPTSNFIRTYIESNHARWNNRVETRFPPEPNGYLHIGHAKSICLNFGLAAEYNGVCHLRFDDTNPEKENQEYVDAIIEAVSWLGFSWKEAKKEGKEHLYFASDYFETMYLFAVWFIKQGLAYVDSSDMGTIRQMRGTLTQPGQNSPFRDRPLTENLVLFEKMKSGQCKEGEHVLRLKIDMASGNINLRDPVIYRIKNATHHRTGDVWHVYPMYDYAHCISDAIESITHSICTLEFEDHRPLYDWVLQKLADGGQLSYPLPQQIEFARLDLTHTLTSKRKLLMLVQQKLVDGWDDPRMPTLLGIRRRGYTPEAIRLFCERIGVSKADSWIDYSTLEQSLRDDLEPKASRLMAVLDPLCVEIENADEFLEEHCQAPLHPHHENRGVREFLFTKHLWIERGDFMEQATSDFFRLTVGGRVRLRYGFVIECTSVEKDASGRVTKVIANYFPDSKSGTPGSANYKVKAAIHWLSQKDAVSVQVRLFDHLFMDPMLSNVGEDLKSAMNPFSQTECDAYVEPFVQQVKPEDRFQFERLGYFVADRFLHQGDKKVFNRICALKDRRN
jgi:glutaminyl-tRNA synthetase